VGGFKAGAAVAETTEYADKRAQAELRPRDVTNAVLVSRSSVLVNTSKVAVMLMKLQWG
jgi:hypothetical protein